MKTCRVLKVTVCILIVLCSCTSFCAAYAVNAEDIFCISIDNCIPGHNYVLMLLKPGTSINSIQDSDLLFIDQYTADKSESMEIALVYPDFSACDAAVSGTFSNNASSPKKLGSFHAARMPQQLQIIEEEAFAGVSFTHVYLGESITDLQTRAFADCPNLIYIYIPDSVTSIAQDAFQGDNGLIIGCKQNSTAFQFAMDHGVSYLLLD